MLAGNLSIGRLRDARRRNPGMGIGLLRRAQTLANGPGFRLAHRSRAAHGCLARSSLHSMGPFQLPSAITLGGGAAGGFFRARLSAGYPHCRSPNPACVARKTALQSADLVA